MKTHGRPSLRVKAPQETACSDWSIFFPPGTSVLALPGWQNPRLYLPTHNPVQRWKQSSFYPAFRLRGRLFRLLFRFKATAKVAAVRNVHSSSWPLREFVQDVLPQVTTTVVMVGTPSPAQEITVQLWDNKDQVLGYIKYAEKEAARTRLRQELFMLSNLPEEVGPEPIKFGALGEGEALLKSVLPGKPLVRALLPPPKELSGLLDSLVVGPAVPLEDHPWVRRLRNLGTPELDTMFEPLVGRDWPVTIQHGDLAPWNLLRRSDGALRAVDWEYGTIEGFLGLDLAHYILQTSALIFNRDPLKSARYAAWYLSEMSNLTLNSAESYALVRLAAYDAYQKVAEDGQFHGDGQQPWRRTIWKSESPVS